MSDDAIPQDETPAEKPAEAPKPKAAAKGKSAAKGKKGADKGKKGADKGKKGAGKKGKKGAGGSGGPSVAATPRAAAQVRRAKGWGGLVGFAAAAYFSYRASVPPELIGLRAIAAGIAGYMVAWACTVTVWRYLLLAELRAAAEGRRASADSAPDAARNPGAAAKPPVTPPPPSL